MLFFIIKTMASSFPIFSDTLDEVLLNLNILDVARQLVDDRILLRSQPVKRFFDPYWNPIKSPIHRLEPWVNDLREMDISQIPDNHPVYDILILKWFYVNLSDEDDKIYQISKDYGMSRLACKLFMVKDGYLIGFSYYPSDETFAPYNYPVLRYSWDTHQYLVLIHRDSRYIHGSTRRRIKSFISEDGKVYEYNVDYLESLDDVLERIADEVNLPYIHKVSKYDENETFDPYEYKYILTNDPDFTRLTPIYQEGKETYLNTDKLELSDTKLAAIDFFNLDEYYK